MAIRNYVAHFLLAATLTSSLAAADPYPISGVQTGIDGTTGQVPIRRDVNAFYTSQDIQWDLYIQSLKAMQEADWDDPLSFYQIAGIHGEPHTPWHDDKDTIANPHTGYCIHGEPSFVPWHRPYLMLFEQTLVGHAIDIANTYPTSVRDDYVHAAETLRMPYWDWALNSDIPPVVAMPTVKVRVPPSENTTSTESTPNGDLSVVDYPNPLYGYTFPLYTAQNGSVFPIPRANEPRIDRCKSGSFPASANTRLRNAGIESQVTTNVFIASSLNSFEEWTNEIESIHNTIHALCTCGGQMAFVPIAAFDPIFMLHHVNVDRLSALVQIINPDVAALNESISGRGLFTTPRSELRSPDSPLRPFWRDDSTRYTHEMVTSLDGLGYAYEGLEYWKLDEAELRSSAIKMVRSYYASTITDETENLNDEDNNTIASNSTASTRKRRIASRAPSVSAIASEGTGYRVRIMLDRTQVERPCTIDVWIGDTKAGTAGILEMPMDGDATMHIPLDGAIAANPTLRLPLVAEAVPAILQQALRLEIKNVNGDVIPLSSVPSLKVDLHEMNIVVPVSLDEMPWMRHSDHKPLDPAFLF